jgi:hypothetical protein
MMIYRKKLSVLNLINMFLINLTICFFLSSIIYYFYSLNTEPIIFISAILCFLLFFLISYILTEKLSKIISLKNIFIISKLILGIITFYTALLILNKFRLNPLCIYLIIIGAASSWSLLNNAQVKHIEKHESISSNLNMSIFKFNIEIILIIVLTVSTFIIIEEKYIPLILILISTYYFISGYLNTFEK